MPTLLDTDIEHIRAAVLQSCNEHYTNALLTPPYWRRRLVEIMRLNHLSKAQLNQVDALLAILDRFDSVHDLSVA
jgi:hypothetical protein